MNCYFCNSTLVPSLLTNRYYCYKCALDADNRCLVEIKNNKILLIELGIRFDKLYITATSVKDGIFIVISTLNKLFNKEDLISYFRYGDFTDDFDVLNNKIHQIARMKSFY